MTRNRRYQLLTEFGAPSLTRCHTSAGPNTSESIDARGWPGEIPSFHDGFSEKYFIRLNSP
jgi:hypothetical protein